MWRGSFRWRPATRRSGLSRVRLYKDEPFAVEDIWLPYDRFRAFYDMALTEIGPLLYPVYENVCGQLVATVEETLTIATGEWRAGAAAEDGAGRAGRHDRPARARA